MFATTRSRLYAIAALLAAAIFALVPRTVSVRERDEKTGVMTDRAVRRVPLKQGLDLQGGMHLALELDQSKKVSADVKRDIELATQVLRKRIDEFGVTEPVIQRSGTDRVIVELAGIKDPERAVALVQKSAFLEFRITDKSGALNKALPSMDRKLRELGLGGAAAAKPAGDAVSKLLGGDAAKAKGADSAKAKAADSAAAATAGGVLADLIQGTGDAGVGEMPGEYLVAETAYPRVDSLLAIPEVKALLPRGIELFWGSAPTSVGVQQYRYLYALEDRAIVTGANLVNAKAQLDPLTNGPEVTFDLDRPGGRKFGDETGRHVGDFLAIVLDGKVQGRPPVIQSRIERNGRISLGGKTMQEAQDLALTLRAGALPVPLKVVDRRQVGASLGADSIRGGIIAGAVGTALVIAIMLGYYAFSGALAVAALALYVLLSLGGLAAFDATLTLPGIAGLILSIGIAVDANVLIFERIREELDHGKTVRLAIDEGFQHAMPAIIDSNLSTLLTALFLFQFGTGPVKGFAVTLAIGIAASMVTAVFVTRTFYQLWLDRQPAGAASLSIGSLRWFKGAAYDFIGFRRVAYGVTAALFAVGLGMLVARGLNYSIEFTGGTLLQVRTQAAVDVAKLRAGLDANGLKGSEIQEFGSDREYVVRARVGEGLAADNNTEVATQAVGRALDATLGAGTYSIERAEAVSPKVGGELRGKAFMAILASFLVVLVYLAYRFEWRFGLAAIIATAHDIVLTIGFIAVMDLEVSLVVVAGLLTMVGYSLNDTIIIFDRVRENLRKLQRTGFVEILNLSINETLPRSILTHGTTLATLTSLAVFGGEVIRPFALVMFFGVFTGTFSSIYIAAPVLLWIEQRWPGPQARAVKAQAPGRTGMGMPARGKVPTTA
ncbi:MAG: protein translocase subunit SecD [Gemmatimonadales bacterium]|nr:protein translocase subunit SecD [Gemmatimonadales bacterium]